MNEWMREDLNFNRRMSKLGCCLLVLVVVLLLLIFSLAIPLLRKLGHGESNAGRYARIEDYKPQERGGDRSGALITEGRLKSKQSVEGLRPMIFYTGGVA